LNDPVRWRFSAFTATVPPQRSESVSDESTGVRLTIPAPAARARWIAAGSIVGRARGVAMAQSGIATTASISTRAFFGSAETSTVARAGGSAEKCSP
jgi:hypothetical protein